MSALIQKKLATTAQQQYEKYHLIRANQEPLASQIQSYWVDLKFKFCGAGEAVPTEFTSPYVRHLDQLARIPALVEETRKPQHRRASQAFLPPRAAPVLDLDNLRGTVCEQS